MMLERSRLGLAWRGVLAVVLSVVWLSSRPAANVAVHAVHHANHPMGRSGVAAMFGLLLYVILAAYVSIGYCIGAGRGGITALELYGQSADWATAVANAGMGPCHALFRTFLWLVCFHLVPPLFSIGAVASAWDMLIDTEHLPGTVELVDIERWLAGAVAVRQALHLLGAFFAAILRPEYLLLSLRATKQKHGERLGWSHMIVYVTAPEKVVGMTLACGSRSGRVYIVRAILCFDACAVAALFLPFVRTPLLPASAPTPLPLMLVYVSVAISALGALALGPENKGWSMEDVKKAGAYTLSEARQAGYTCAEARAAGYSCVEVRQAGHPSNMLRVAGFTCTEARAAGYSCMEARVAGYTCVEVSQAGYASKMLKVAGFTCREAWEAGFVEGLRAAGYTIGEAKAAGYVEGLKLAGYSCKESKAAGFTVEECARGGFTYAEVKASGLVHDEATARLWEKAAKAAGNKSTVWE